MKSSPLTPRPVNLPGKISISFPFHSHLDRNYTIDQCSKQGMYCYQQENITYKTTCKSLGSSDSFDSSCPNITLAFELCPDGFYCPNNHTKKTCPIGSSCFFAAHRPRLCPIQGLLCPYEGMSNPTEGAMIITFVLIFFLVLFAYKWISDHIVAQRERYIDSGTLLESQQQTQGPLPPFSPLH
jgi:hypothetical protein